MTVIKDERYHAEEWARKADEIYAGYGKSSSCVKVPAATLNSVLKPRGIATVDLLVLDTEGSEADILRGLDLKSIKIKYALIEIHTAERRSEIERILGGKLVARIAANDYLYRVT